jgi:flagellin
MRINNNIMAMNAHRQLGANQAAGAKSMEKLSSGLRINRAADDAAGLAISEKMRAQVRGLKQASRNAQDAISLIQTAEGALNETHAILQRMRELAVQSSNDTNTDDDRIELQKEITDLLAEVDRISTDTTFNTKVLMDGSLSGAGAAAGAGEMGVLSGEPSVTLNGDLTNSTFVSSVDFVSGDISDGATVSVTQEITYSAESDVGEADGAFESIKVIVGFGGETGEVEFNATEIGEGTTSKNVSIKGVTFEVNIDGSVASTEGNLVHDTFGADTLTAAVTPAGDGDGDGDGDGVTPPPAPTGGLTFHIGANSGQNITLQFEDMSSTGLQINAIDISTQAGADAAQTTLDGAIKAVSAERSKLGAAQNRLEHTISNLGTSAENLQAAESRIRDLDMAEEIMAFTKNNILQQAATAMLAQANMAPQSVLQLLG